MLRQVTLPQAKRAAAGASWWQRFWEEQDGALEPSRIISKPTAPQGTRLFVRVWFVTGAERYRHSREREIRGGSRDAVVKLAPRDSAAPQQAGSVTAASCEGEAAAK